MPFATWYSVKKPQADRLCERTSHCQRRLGFQCRLHCDTVMDYLGIQSKVFAKRLLSRRQCLQPITVFPLPPPSPPCFAFPSNQFWAARASCMTRQRSVPYPEFFRSTSRHLRTLYPATTMERRLDHSILGTRPPGNARKFQNKS